MKVKYPYIAYDVTFCSIFLKTSILLLLIRDYQRLIWVRESKVTEGGGRWNPPPQVENILNRPGKIGLNDSMTIY